jgi:K+/H+ antiporter YhaU regulatory subunit KhtT
MAEKKAWDLTSAHSLAGAAEWIRKNSGAALVLVVRGEDVVFAVDPAMPRYADAVTMVEVAMPELEKSWIEIRARKAREGK